MGVNAQVGVPVRRKIHRRPEHAPAAAVAAQAVDGGIGGVAAPGTVLNGGVGRVLPRDQGKGAAGALPCTDHPKNTLGNILPEQFQRRVGGSPLGRVAVGCHNAPGLAVNFSQGGQVLRNGLANGQSGLLCLLHLAVSFIHRESDSL